MGKKKSFLLLVALFLMRSAYGEQEVVFPKKLLCATHQFAPYVYLEDKRIQGVEAEVFELLGQRLGIKIKIVLMPWARALSEAKSGNVDCLFAAFKSPEREHYLDFTTTPLHISELVFFKHKSTDIDYHSDQDLNGRILAMVRGFKNPENIVAMQSRNQLTYVEVAGLMQSFQMLQKKRAELVLFNRFVGEYILKQNPQLNIEAMRKPVRSTPAYIAISKKRQWPDLIPRIDQELALILISDRYQKIIAGYQQSVQAE